MVVQFLGCTVYASYRSCRPDSGRWLYKYNWANRQHHPLPVFGNPTLPIDSTEHGDFHWSRVQRWWNKNCLGAKHAIEFKEERNARERMELPETTSKLLEISKKNKHWKWTLWDFDIHILNLSVHPQVWKHYPLAKRFICIITSKLVYTSNLLETLWPLTLHYEMDLVILQMCSSPQQIEDAQRHLPPEV